MEEREGTVDSIMANKETGVVKDKNDGKYREFTNPALIDLQVGQGIVYILISTPKGDISVVKNKK